MVRRIVVAALLLAMGAAMPAWAGDRDDCRGPEPTTLLKTDPVRVATACRKLAEMGNAMGQSRLGVLYATGQGVPQDDAEAAKWYRKSAEQGYVAGQVNLGAAYADGRGVPKDDAMAADWFRKAAVHGYAPAQVNLGIMYANGWGVTKDNIAAYMWFSLSAHEVGAAAKNRDFVATQMTPSQIAQAKALAARESRRRGNSGATMAQAARVSTEYGQGTARSLRAGDGPPRRGRGFRPM